MTLLHLMTDGALAAAELLALLLVPPAAAAEAATVEAPAALERPVQLHRLSTMVDVRLLGSLADVRVTQHLRNDGTSTADIAPQLPAIDEQVDALRVVHAGRVVDLLAPGDCGDGAAPGHARLSEDEAIADALQLAPGAEAAIEVARAQVLVRSGRGYRVALPVRVDGEAPRAMLVDQSDARFLVVVPHRRAATSTLVLRPVGGTAETFHLGAVDPGIALVIPLAGRAQLEALADGAIELELRDQGLTYWTTLVADRIDERPAVQAGVAE